MSGNGDVVSLGFNHSVEKVLVVDTFLVTGDDSLLLVNTTYGSMGAGLPSDESYNITTDGHGNFTINDINESFRSINFMTGPIPKHYLIVAGEKLSRYIRLYRKESLYFSLSSVILLPACFLIQSGLIFSV